MLAMISERRAELEQQARELHGMKHLTVKDSRYSNLLQTKGRPMSQTRDVTVSSAPPPPSPPVNRKVDLYDDPSVFDVIDREAIEVASEDQSTFTELVRQLTRNCVTDVEKARVIFRWITVTNLNTMEFNETHVDADTPMGLLRGIKVGTESYHVLFRRLCSYAGLHGMVIKGFSKSAGYLPGKKFDDKRFRNTWNAVYVAGSWRFVQCNWGARHLVNAKDAPRPSEQSQVDNLRYEYDDHYFLTDPDQFIYEFFPCQPEWQLLRHPLALQQFENLPFVRSLFFKYGLRFADERQSAVMVTDAIGAVTARVLMPRALVENLVFHYNLRLEGSDADVMDGVSMRRYVMQTIVGNSVVFKVHTALKGRYILDVFANLITAGHNYLTGKPMRFKSVCKLGIACTHLERSMVPLPDCATGEWGPLKAYKLFGLIPRSHENAVINTGGDVRLSFVMRRPLRNFQTALRQNGADEKVLSRYVKKVLTDETVTFDIRFPSDGQYGLDIYTREVAAAAADVGADDRGKQQKQLLTHCCKYLINVRQR
ncbi:PREDICTED: kyphoscoliosis peptidase-like [Priapulus caudatus]|uniref:Kyphoscoliosis peptidase-like n=1 Tax=Priapulus caudatus TaxID=37621 RepID=A0ABM1EF03_PRICU|nr:PREDICTED: kyphoscoliosis peptidase-like [Priapulus caudatus]